MLCLWNGNTRMLHFSMLRPSTILKPPPHMRYFPVWNCRGSLMKGYGCFMEYTRLFYTLYILLQAFRFMPVLCIWHTPKYEKNKKAKNCKYKWIDENILNAMYSLDTKNVNQRIDFCLEQKNMCLRFITKNTDIFAIVIISVFAWEYCI